MEKSKLHRVFSTGGAPLFNLAIGTKTYTDNEIISISITRGGASYGSNPTVLEVKLKGWQRFNRNEHVELKLTDVIRPKIGISYQQTVWRFYGRVGTVETEDRGDNKTAITTIMCSSYSTLLKLSPTPIPLEQRELVQNVIAKAITTPRVGNRIKLYQLADTSSLDAGRIYLAADEEPAKPFKDVLSEYVEKAKTLLAEMRDGKMRILTLAFRDQMLDSQVASRYAPLRSSVLAPARFAQDNDVRSHNLRYIWRELDASTTTQLFGALNINDALPEDVETKEEKIESIIVPYHVRPYIARAENASVNAALRGYDSITLDILALLSTGTTYQRYVAFEALRLEHGDALFFGGDWKQQPWAMIARRITETISHDTYRISIDLDHPMEVIGRASPKIYPPRVWDQAVSTQWDQDERQWA